MTDKYCTDCYYMFWIDEEYEEMGCTHGNAIPENEAPVEMGSEPHNCPFFEEKELEE